MVSVRGRIQTMLIVGVLFSGMFGVPPHRVEGATFAVRDGDVAGLIRAITQANDENAYPGPDTIDLSEEGTYTLSAVVDETFGATGLPAITSQITINGSGATIKRSEAEGTPRFRILLVTDEGFLELNHVTIVNGDISGSRFGPFGDGGGLLNTGGVVHISGSTISGNKARNWGGGLANGGQMIIGTSHITDNVSEFCGGGIDNFGTSGSSLEIVQVTISGNHAPTGGGIGNRGMLSLSDSTISENTADDGAGIANFNSGSFAVTATTFSDNVAENAGGGIFNSSPGSANITASTFSNNTAKNVGGGLSTGPDTKMVIAGSTFTDNSTQTGGGGIASAGAITVTGSLFSGNNGPRGGAALTEGDMTVEDSTFDDNIAEDFAGGILNWRDAVLTVSNSAFSLNEANWGGAVVNGGEMHISGSTFTGNVALEGAGAIGNAGEAEFHNSTFDANRAGLGGGAVFNEEGGTATFTGCTMTNNIADYAGGIYNNGGTAHVEDTTLDANTADKQGGRSSTVAAACCS